MPAALRRAEMLARRFVRDRFVVLLGLRVGRAFGLTAATYFERVQFGRATVVVVPHPSGVNRWYNSAANVRRMRRFMREAL